MMNRREFLATSLATGLTLTASAQRSETGFRTITYNVLGCRGYPKTRENAVRLEAAQGQIAERIADEVALYAPDILTLQEGPTEEVTAQIAARLNMNHVWFPCPWPGNKQYPGGFPGAIITRFPILESKNCPLEGNAERPEALFTRHWGMAVLDTPSGRLPIFSAHLHPSEKTTRLDEIEAALKVIQPALESEGRVLLQGDLNHKPDTQEYRRWRDAGLVDCFAEKGVGPHTKSMSSTNPRSRIDYVWAGGTLTSRIESARILYEGNFRTNPDDPASFALSDHIPVIAKFG